MLQKFRPQATWPRAASLRALVGVAAVAAGLFASTVVASSTRQDALDIADAPLGILGDQAKPNVMLLLDTSDSMKWSHMPDDWEKNANFFPVGYKSALCNSLYYNPETGYALPKRSDGITDMPVPTFSAAWKDGYDQTLGTVNLATAFQAYDGDTRRQRLNDDPPQRAYYFQWRPSSATFPTMPSWERETSCTWPSEPQLLADDGSVQNSGMVSQRIDGVPRNEMRGRWIRTPISSAAQERNFAIWYSYYRTRINMAKSSISLAFGTLNDNFRIGFLTVAKPGSGAHSHFLPVQDFAGADKEAWFQSIQGTQTGGTSPTREALARVGRYYAGKSDSINDSMLPFVDPVISACQRHYTIVTTDGYWNVGQETPGKGPVQIDGVTLVGQQDGPPLSLTGAEGLRPRPIYDGSVSGHRLEHDASVSYDFADCTIGWKVTVPGGGTKTEATYKKIIKKDVMRRSWYSADLHWWQKTSTQVMRISHKAPSGTHDQEKGERQYWHAQGTHTQTKNLYQQRVSWNYINKRQYRNKLVTTWNTETQTPWARATASQIREKRYFYWYKNPALGEVDLKTTDKAVCEAFASSCQVEPPGGDSWKVVEACTPGMTGDYKLECDGPTVRDVSASTYCSQNGRYVPGVGTITCQGVTVPAYSGPVLACNSLHPQLAADIVAAGGNTAMVEYSNCDRSHREERYVLQDQCTNIAATLANGFRSTTCTREVVNGDDGETDNSCQITGAPEWDAATSTYTECRQRGASEMAASCEAGSLPDQPGRMNTICEGPGRPVSSTTVAPSTCQAGIEGNYTVECTNAQSSWSGPISPEPRICRTGVTPTHDLSCEMRSTHWRAVQSCTPEAPTPLNGWVGTGCNDGTVVPPGPGLCTPAPGMGGVQVPPPSPADPTACSPQEATPGNGCIYSVCQRMESYEDVAACSPSNAIAPNWTSTSCQPRQQRQRSRPDCQGPVEGYKAVGSCQPRSTESSIGYGTCDAIVANEPGAGRPVAENSWQTTTCEKVDESTPEGIVYLQSEADFATCKAGTDEQGVETQCKQEGPLTVDVSKASSAYPATTQRRTK